MIAQWFESQLNSNKKLEPDSFLCNKINEIKHDSVLNHLKGIIENHPDIALESIDHMVQVVSAEKLKELIDILTEKFNKMTSSKSSNKE